MLVVSGNDEAGIVHRKSCCRGPGHVIQSRIEVEHVAILFRHAAVVVIANAGSDAEVGQYLPLVLHIAVDLVGAIVAIGIVAAVSSDRCSRPRWSCAPRPAENCRIADHDLRMTGAVIGDIQLRVAVAATGKMVCLPAVKITLVEGFTRFW